MNTGIEVQFEDTPCDLLYHAEKANQIIVHNDDYIIIHVAAQSMPYYLYVTGITEMIKGCMVPADPTFELVGQSAVLDSSVIAKLLGATDVEGIKALRKAGLV